MRRTWQPDPGWTGAWETPPVLSRRLTQKERGCVVALSCAGMGPAQLARNLATTDRIEDVAGAHADGWRSALAGPAGLGARAVVPSDDEYPEALRHTAAPPPLLYVRGGRLDEMEPMVAIVGARACTTGAARFAQRLGEAVARTGFTVVSGLARGIDVAAHRGALAGGRTIAVLGSGIDVCYPSEHAEIAERIAASGALVTEFPRGVGPRAWHFPARNRIIAGMSLALVVVEAGLGSGALITAGFALDGACEVYACTTGPDNPAGAGVRAMLRDGAALIVDEEQAVEDLVALARQRSYDMDAIRARAADAAVVALEGDLKKVYEAVLDGSTIEEVAATTQLGPHAVSAALAELELDGLVASDRGRWRRR